MPAVTAKRPNVRFGYVNKLIFRRTVASGLIPPQVARPPFSFYGRKCAFLGRENGKPTYFKLFAHAFAISAFTFGGGYVMITLMKERFVDKLGWIDEDELSSLTAIGQSAPGAIVLNVNVLMGYRLLGLRGALCALMGTALPPLVILCVISYFYDVIRGNRYVSAAFRGMQAGVSAVIADAVVTMAAPFMKKDEAAYIMIMAASFAAAWFFDVNVAFIIITCGLLGVIFGAIRGKRRKGT